MSTNKPKITPGKWRYKTAFGDSPHAVLGPPHPVDGGDYSPICRLDKESDARLIAEAGTVANETGLWPREMAEQRNFLLDACRLLYDEMGKRISPAAFNEFSEEAKDLLEKALAAAWGKGEA